MEFTSLKNRLIQEFISCFPQYSIGSIRRLVNQIRINSNNEEQEYILNGLRQKNPMVIRIWKYFLKNDRLENIDTTTSIPLGIHMGNNIQRKTTQNLLNVKRYTSNTLNTFENVIIPNVSFIILYTNKNFQWVRIRIDSEKELINFPGYKYHVKLTDDIYEVYFNSVSVEEVFRYIETSSYIKRVSFYSDLKNMMMSKTIANYVKLSNFVKFMLTYESHMLWPEDMKIDEKKSIDILIYMTYGTLFLKRTNLGNTRCKELSPFQVLSGTAPLNSLRLRLNDSDVHTITNIRDSQCLNDIPQIGSVSKCEFSVKLNEK